MVQTNYLSKLERVLKSNPYLVSPVRLLCIVYHSSHNGLFRCSDLFAIAFFIFVFLVRLVFVKNGLNVPLFREGGDHCHEKYTTVKVRPPYNMLNFILKF